jgi:4-methylaminobutanoate oxidase (formaldehyde-forming)
LPVDVDAGWLLACDKEASMRERLPERAQVVIVGGGVVGCSVAYHLTKRGWRDVVVLERKQLTSGTTWHAAGLVTLARPTYATRELVKHSLDVFASLEAETGLGTGFRRTGTIHLAMSVDRAEEMRRQASAGRSNGIEIEHISAERAGELFPPLDPTGVVSALYYPQDGRGNATDTTMSLAKGARAGGARLFERTRVTGVSRRGNRVVGVSTEVGDIEAEYVVNATGMWGREFGAQAQVSLPLQALAHYYVVTENIPGLPANMPTIKSPDDWSYVKDDSGALMVGFFEPGSYPWAPHGIPAEAEYATLPEDWDHLGPFYEQMVKRVPVLADAGIRLFFAGPESFTPDGFFHFGAVPGIDNYFAACGFNSIGFLTGPGAGKVLADWIIDGRAPLDLPEVDPRRVMPFQTNRRYLERRVVETLDVAYAIHWPFEQRSTARGIRRSPVHDRVAEHGAVFGEVAGWERANYYTDPGVDAVGEMSFGRPAFFDAWAREHRAVREKVALFDLSSFGKLLVQGRDAEPLLSRVSAAAVDVEPGTTVYTQWLNAQGGIEADVTVTRLAEDRYLVLTAAATVVREMDHLRRHLDADTFAVATDVSSAYAMFTVMGPRSRALLAGLTDADLSNATFPFRTSREIDLGLTYVRATRITYVGELGWELLIPAESAVHVYDTIVAAGAAFELEHAGYHALNSLRLEKGYRSWGHDIGWLDTPTEAGLGFAVAWDKPGGFCGREQALRVRTDGTSRLLVSLSFDDPEVMAFHDEPILRNGKICGRITSAAYGHTLSRSVALGYVGAGHVINRDWVAEGSYEVEVASVRQPVTVSLRPFYDPRSERVRD